MRSEGAVARPEGAAARSEATIAKDEDAVTNSEGAIARKRGAIDESKAAGGTSGQVDESEERVRSLRENPAQRLKAKEDDPDERGRGGQPFHAGDV